MGSLSVGGARVWARPAAGLGSRQSGSGGAPVRDCDWDWDWDLPAESPVDSLRPILPRVNDFALQLYTVRHALAAHPSETLRRVRAAGFEQVETAPRRPNFRHRDWHPCFGITVFRSPPPTATSHGAPIRAGYWTRPSRWAPAGSSGTVGRRIRTAIPSEDSRSFWIGIWPPSRPRAREACDWGSTTIGGNSRPSGTSASFRGCIVTCPRRSSSNWMCTGRRPPAWIRWRCSPSWVGACGWST